jgi:hypothetical protein
MEIAPLLTRFEKLTPERKYPMTDASDVPHAIIASLKNCDAIITYDSHFNDIKTVIPVMTPEEFLQHHNFFISELNMTLPN